MAMGKNYRVLEKKMPEQAHSVILEHRSKPETLLFESQAVANLCKQKNLSIFSPTKFLLWIFFAAAQETEAVRKQYSKIVDAYGCLGVLQLNAGESTILYLVMVTGCFRFCQFILNSCAQ